MFEMQKSIQLYRNELNEGDWKRFVLLWSSACMQNVFAVSVYCFCYAFFTYL